MTPDRHDASDSSLHAVENGDDSALAQPTAQAPRAPVASTNLFRNFNRLIGVAYGALLIVLTLFFAYLLHRNLQEEIGLIKGDVARHGQFFEFVLRASADQLETFRMSTSSTDQEQSPATAEAILDRPPGAWLREDAERGIFHLDALPNRDSAGNLIGLGSLHGRDAQFYDDLDTALRLNGEWSSLIFTLPNAAEARFVTVDSFQAILPWRPSIELTFDPEIYDSPVWTMGQPATNPDRQKYWAPVYFAGPERGLLAPVAAPVHDGERFVGILSIDVSIDYLNRINADFNYPLGITLLVDQRRQVLTHPELFAKPLQVDRTQDLAQALPPELASETERLLRLPPGTPTHLNGYLVIRYGLVSAPWSLFYLVPLSDLRMAVASDMGAHMIAVLIGLALLMGLTYLLTAREFVGPAAKLVAHIASESNFVPTTIPVVPSGWRPWFETITRAFRESLQLVALRQELSIAASMQQSILPRHWPQDSRYSLWGMMRPAREIGGDFYDHFALPGNRLGLVVADVSGKGVPAGLFAMVSKTLLRSAAIRGELSIREMMAEVNDGLAEDNENCMFVTLFYAQFDPDTGRLDYVNAGHPSPLLVHADGTVSELPLTRGMALGALEGLGYASASIQLSPGDTLLMFSDGVTEAMNARHEEFGDARLSEQLRGSSPRNPREAVERVLTGVDRFASEVEQADDITCVALRYCSDQPPPECRNTDRQEVRT
ncbi:PP2C family protein-serine/threonine phosphatase [Imhoffiella purpurea]|uniref:Response regulator receiver modulated serine phosphatase n=1 Tax=Imhoffiella purpurea TaxID=1249627 RepID=W9VWP9_9GAMM|nr:SpoIIE family protein phosphatase [Imhoffiella purpurea]EXJ14830.1 response regulator receiver modulated serine phosphatase [Imhoffiella purpurea]